MATLNISITDKMRAYIDQRVRDGDFVSASDFIRCLIRADSAQQLEHLLLEGAQSGKGATFGSPEWDALLESVRSRATGGQDTAA